MPDPADKITIIAAPADSIEETHGAQITESRLYPGLGSVAVPTSRSPLPPSTTKVLFGVRILQPALAAGVWSYTVSRDVTPQVRALDWEYLRFGGLGSFQVQLAAELRPDATTWAGNRYEVEVNVRLASDSALATWYRGIIENQREVRSGGGMQIIVEGAGFVHELRKIRVNRSFAAGTTVRSMVETIIDGDIVGNNSRILKDTSKLITAGASYTSVGKVTTEMSAYDAMKILGEFQGSVQWGIDAEREFFFLANPGTTDQRQYFVGKNLVDPIRASRNWENYTAVET